MLEWLLERLGVVIFVVIFLVQLVRGVLRARRDRPPPQTSKPDELEEQRRVREIQEQIRRRIAERRGEHVPEAEAAPATAERREVEPPPLERRAETTQLPDPFEGPLRRVMEEFERRAQPAPPAPAPAPAAPPVLAERRFAELERQEQREEDARVLEESRVLARRRASKKVAALHAATQTGNALRAVAREELLADVRDPHGLRRAMVLREVLGPPVGLR